MLALGLLASAVTLAAGPAQTVQPGTYVRVGDAETIATGTMTVRKGPNGLTFEIESMGGNCHICSVSGSIEGLAGKGGDSDPLCAIAFVPESAGGISVQPAESEGCRAYCGARASFDGTYRIPPEGCTGAKQQERRNAFLRLYRARKFAEARPILENLTSQCAAYINWIQIDSDRNDLALAQLHSGDAPACLATLKQTRAAQYDNEAALKDSFPPCDFDNYIKVARASWYNKALCEKAGKKE